MQLRNVSWLSVLFVTATTSLLSCSSGKGYDWTSLSAATPATYTPGTPVVLAQATIDASGGTLTGPAGTPLDGVVLTIPAGAVSGPTTFSLGYDDGGSFANVSADELSGLVIAIDTDGQHQFSQPLTVEFTFTDPVNFPIPYYLNADGSFELQSPLPVDRAAGRGGFLTWHASNYTWVNKSPKSSRPVWNGFSPNINGLVFSNTIEGDYLSARCTGIASFSKWYKETQGNGLYGKFKASVPSQAGSKKGQSISGEEVLATRAHISVTLDSGEYVFPTQQAEAIVAVNDALDKGAKAVLIGTTRSSKDHTMLAIAHSDNQIAVYDSNHPGEWKAMDYTLDGTGGSTLTYGVATEISLPTDLPQAEPFSFILRDAQASFNGENQTKIEVTSNQSGDTVQSEDVTLEGNVYSGEVSISVLEVTVLYADGTTSDVQTANLDPGQEDFSVDLKLKAAVNTIAFVTQGYVSPGAGWQVIPNDGGVAGSGVFTLQYYPPPNSVLSVTGSQTTETSDSYGPLSKEVESWSFSTNLSYQAFPTTMQSILDGTFPFSECTIANCAVVTGQNSLSMDQPDILLPVNISYTEQDYTRLSNDGGLVLTGQSNGQADLTWQPVYLEIDLEPLSTADNRQYRIRIYPGCNNDLCAPAGAPRTTNQCLDQDTQTFYVCGSSLLTVPLSDVLNMIDNTNLATITPPRIESGDFETFVTSGTAPDTWTPLATQNDDTTDPGVSTVSNYSVSLTLAP
jgi:hypothetical protein